MTTVAVVTPWLAHPELLPAYAAAVERADHVTIINNGPSDMDADFLHPGWTVSKANEPTGFAASNNMGLELLPDDIDVVVFLNNDVHGDPAWIDRVREDVKDGALYGPSVGTQTLRGVPIPYVEGWCVAATRDTWETLGGWDAERFPLPYWEDVDLSLRAIRAGFQLCRAPWPIHHLGGVSTNSTPGAWDGFDSQRAVIEADLDEVLA